MLTILSLLAGLSVFFFIYNCVLWRSHKTLRSQFNKQSYASWKLKRDPPCAFHIALKDAGIHEFQEGWQDGDGKPCLGPPTNEQLTTRWKERDELIEQQRIAIENGTKQLSTLEQQNGELNLKLGQVEFSLSEARDRVTRLESQLKAKDEKLADLSEASESKDKIISDLRDKLQAIEDARPLEVGDQVTHTLGGKTLIITAIDKNHAVCEWLEDGRPQAGRYKLSTLKRRFRL